MKNHIVSIALTMFAGALTFSACKPNDNPKPAEQELITTARLTLTAGGVSRSFNYKVENGFNSDTPGVVVIDTIKVAPNTVYSGSVQVLNESVTPAKDLTAEIVSEQLEHLFLFSPTPASGPGSLTFSGGNKDSDNKPFNLTGTFTSGAAGSGSMVLYLIHAPTDKNGATPVASGGETDIQATFPVRIQ